LSKKKKKVIMRNIGGFVVPKEGTIVLKRVVYKQNSFPFELFTDFIQIFGLSLLPITRVVGPTMPHFPFLSIKQKSLTDPSPLKSTMDPLSNYFTYFFHFLLIKDNFYFCDNNMSLLCHSYLICHTTLSYQFIYIF